MGIEKPRAGTPLPLSPVGSAAFQSDLVDLVNAYKAGNLARPSSAAGLSSLTDTVTIKNTTGGNLARGAAVRLASPLLDPADPRKPWFTAAIFSSGYDLHARAAITVEAIAADEYGKAQVSGRVLAHVNVADALHGYALPQTSGGTLTTTIASPFELLTMPADTGEQDLWLNIRGGCPVLRVRTTDTFSVGVPANDYIVLKGANASEVDTGITTIPDAVAWVAIADDTLCLAYWCGGGFVLMPAECP